VETEYDKFRNDIVNLQHYLDKFKVEFLDREGFKSFVDIAFKREASLYEELAITGYFSETIRSEIEYVVNYYKSRERGEVRLISPEFDARGKRDQRNLQALQKMAEKGVKIRINDRMHARFLVAYTLSGKMELMGGLLLLGSFDFNTECIGKERYDAGILTKHPDLVLSAIKLFNKIWEEDSMDLNEWLDLKKQKT